MTVNYTTLLALGQPVTGTESGTWGDDVNNAVTSYLDIAIAGTLSLTSSNFTAGALTLANTQGTSSATNIASTTAQYMVIKVSSLATASTITAPSTSKLYLVDNTDATYTVTIKASGQTGVTVPVSTKVWVYFNGTDYVQVSTSAGTGNVTLAGNNAFTGANTFYNTTGQTFGRTATQDGFVIGGANNGSSSYRITFAPAALSSSTTLTFPNVTSTVAVLGTAQTFTAAQTFRAASAVRSEAASTQDAVVIAGRAGGTSSYASTLTPTTLTANRTLTLPDSTGTVATVGTAVALSIVFGL